MASLESCLLESGLPVEALMEKAALAISRRLMALLDDLPHLKSTDVLMLVGPGHNGGDGLVVARELHLAGRSVRLWSPFRTRKPLTAAHWRHALWLGIPVMEQTPDPADRSLWIDALFGVGQTRPPEEEIESLLIERQRCRPGLLLAIDAPTGLCTDTGQRLGRGAATAAITFGIGLIKQGLVQDPALTQVGRLERIDLSFPASLLTGLPREQPLGLGNPACVLADQLSAPWPWLNPAAGKYDRGRLLVVAGSRAYRGAAPLALCGATASGCGSIRAAIPEELADSLWQVHPHVVLEASLGVTEAGGLALADLPVSWLERLDAVLIGPGIGHAFQSAPDLARGWIPAAEMERWRQLQEFSGLVVVDADGLNRLARGVGKEAECDEKLGPGGAGASQWLRDRHGPTWITPHQGEFARLFPDLIGLPPLEAAGAAARRSGVTVLLKGARTVVAGSDGRRWQLLGASADAARAGLGDVLAGYGAGRGAMALAAARASGMAGDVDASLLAAAALNHAQAGLQVCKRLGKGGTTPMAVAAALQDQPDGATRIEVGHSLPVAPGCG